MIPSMPDHFRSFPVARPQKVEVQLPDRADKFFDRVRGELEITRHTIKEDYDFEILFSHFGAIYAVSRFGPHEADTLEIEVHNQDEGTVTRCYVPIEQANILIHIFPKSRPQPPRRFIGFLTPNESPAESFSNAQKA